MSRSLDSLTMFWWLPILPSLAIFLICFLANLFADGVRHALKGGNACGISGAKSRVAF